MTIPLFVEDTLPSKYIASPYQNKIWVGGFPILRQNQIKSLIDKILLASMALCLSNLSQ